MNFAKKDPPVGHIPESIFPPFRGAAARKSAPDCFDGKISQPLVMNTTSFPRELANWALNDKAEVPRKHKKNLSWITKSLKTKEKPIGNQ